MRPSIPAIYPPKNVATASSGPRSKPWRVRSKVDGGDVSSHFARERDAWRYYTKLIEARDEGLRFDPATGEPVTWAGVDITTAEWAHRWFRRRFPHLMPRTRDGYVEGLAEVLPHLVASNAPSLNSEEVSELRRDIRAWLAIDDAPTPKFLSRFSVPLSALAESGACLRAEHEIVKGRDGKLRSPRTSNRYRVTANTLLNAAVDEKLLDTNPWPKVRGRAVKERNSFALFDKDLLPSIADIEASVARLETMRTRQVEVSDYAIIIWLCGLAGLRPGEARALHVEDLRLPEQDWGDIIVSRSMSDSSDALRGDDPSIGETKTGRSRRVPISPRLVRLLRDHVGDRTSGLVAQTKSGGPIGLSALHRSWAHARGESRWRVYDLRHSCATRWLRAIGNVPEVARRLGHSPEVLLRIYAGILPGDEKDANARIEATE